MSMDKILFAKFAKHTAANQGAAASAPATPSAKHTRDCTDAFEDNLDDGHPWGFGIDIEKCNRI